MYSGVISSLFIAANSYHFSTPSLPAHVSLKRCPIYCSFNFDTAASSFPLPTCSQPSRRAGVHLHYRIRTTTFQGIPASPIPPAAPLNPPSPRRRTPPDKPPTSCSSEPPNGSKRVNGGSRDPFFAFLTRLPSQATTRFSGVFSPALPPHIAGICPRRHRRNDAEQQANRQEYSRANLLSGGALRSPHMLIHG